MAVIQSKVAFAKGGQKMARSQLSSRPFAVAGLQHEHAGEKELQCFHTDLRILLGLTQPRHILRFPAQPQWRHRFRTDLRTAADLIRVFRPPYCAACAIFGAETAAHRRHEREYSDGGVQPSKGAQEPPLRRGGPRRLPQRRPWLGAGQRRWGRRNPQESALWRIRRLLHGLFHNLISSRPGYRSVCCHRLLPHRQLVVVWFDTWVHPHPCHHCFR